MIYAVLSFNFVCLLIKQKIKMHKNLSNNLKTKYNTR